MSNKPPKVIPMPARGPAGEGRKAIKTQADVDAVPPASGDWSVEGVPGLFLRAGARAKTYRIQRRIHGRLVVRVLGEMTLAQARREAMKTWSSLKPAPVEGRMTLEQAWARYLSEKMLAAKTRRIYAENLERYLRDWKPRTLEELGNDRAGVRARYHDIARRHGLATASSVFRTLRAVYRYMARVQPDLPPAPTVAVDIATPKARDWALADEELRQWWFSVQKLSPLKRMIWLTLLLTGARQDSVRLLRWRDVDLERKVMRFSAAKGGRTYSVPISGRLARLLERWRELCPPDSEWVFESPVQPGHPLSAQVRDDKRGVCSPHHLRHTMRTRLAEAGATPDLARIALGHALTQDVSQRYITSSLLVEAVRPLFEQVAERYAAILGWADAGPDLRPETSLR
ncbi:MAG: tyrosine-type recombinase/integrase [Bacillota bacterium]